MLVNLAAMDRARFLVYKGVYFVTARPWAERCSWFTHCFILTAWPRAEAVHGVPAVLFFFSLTAQPWAETVHGLPAVFLFFFNRAAMGRGGS